MEDVVVSSSSVLYPPRVLSLEAQASAFRVAGGNPAVRPPRERQPGARYYSREFSPDDDEADFGEDPWGDSY